VRRGLFRGASGIAIAVGFFSVAWWLGSTRPVRIIDPVPSTRVALPAPQASTPRDEEQDRLRDEVARLKSALKKEGAAVEEVMKTNSKLVGERDRAVSAIRTARIPNGADRPLPFPPDDPPGFQPSEFKAVSARAAEDCGMNLQVVESDCSEYPCIAYMKLKSGETHGRYSMGDCAPWTDALGSDTTVRSVPSADGGVAGFAWLPVPPKDRAIAIYRSRERIDKRLREIGTW
jgi:hypothetical protein